MRTSRQEASSGGTCPRTRVITKFAEYVGSFAVKEADSRRRLWIIEEQMRALKDCPRRRAVILKFCLQGIKMYDADGETLLMAHALRRIQYTTCRPEDGQFAFVSRNPHGQPNHLFCHLFMGSQPSEAQVLNLLLCRSFQLQYLAIHPEVGEQKDSASSPAKVQKRGVGGVFVRKPLDPEEVSQNVNALVSFRRLLVTEEGKNGSNQSEAQRSSSIESPYCSPTLVRKKAIRSKVLRSGAYRFPKSEPPAQERRAEDRSGYVVTELSEKLEALLDAVWFFAGVDRDKSVALLKNDRMGAFLLQPGSECGGQFTLYMSTQCGVIPYKIYTTTQAKYYFEHLPQEFPSLTDLVAHHSGTDSSLFFQLAHGRVNPCYEAQDVKASQQCPLTQHKTTPEPKLKEPAKMAAEQPTCTDVATVPAQMIYDI
ncbi:SH2 domain-containing protein 5 isoform X1 [Bufo gargarizans]|uniref:SH2 domain-containing protein 5 isoform X1 n=1 Tax=Bufo gargarizans TaxID=30331 RepID=UPI001CF2ED9E|nr:SH2 domain-containing protein 5 isoform X1 [Bufo gargarizans]XP_044134519.1 SH2 domain-containing protein 5 isoform X1 [Bufo gargarizans]